LPTNPIESMRLQIECSEIRKIPFRMIRIALEAVHDFMQHDDIDMQHDDIDFNNQIELAITHINSAMKLTRILPKYANKEQKVFATIRSLAELCDHNPHLIANLKNILTFAI